MEGVRYVLEPLEVMHHVQWVLEVMLHALEVVKGVWEVVLYVVRAAGTCDACCRCLRLCSAYWRPWTTCSTCRRC